MQSFLDIVTIRAADANPLAVFHAGNNFRATVATPGESVFYLWCTDHLRPSDVLGMLAVCREWREAGESQMLWSRWPPLTSRASAVKQLRRVDNIPSTLLRLAAMVPPAQRAATIEAHRLLEDLPTLFGLCGDWAHRACVDRVMPIFKNVSLARLHAMDVLRMLPSPTALEPQTEALMELLGHTPRRDRVASPEDTQNPSMLLAVQHTSALKGCVEEVLNAYDPCELQSTVGHAWQLLDAPHVSDDGLVCSVSWQAVAERLERQREEAGAAAQRRRERRAEEAANALAALAEAAREEAKRRAREEKERAAHLADEEEARRHPEVREVWAARWVRDRSAARVAKLVEVCAAAKAHQFLPFDEHGQEHMPVVQPSHRQSYFERREEMAKAKLSEAREVAAAAVASLRDAVDIYQRARACAGEPRGFN